MSDDGPKTFGIQGDPNPSPESREAIEAIMQAAYDEMVAEEAQRL